MRFGVIHGLENVSLVHMEAFKDNSYFETVVGLVLVENGPML